MRKRRTSTRPPRGPPRGPQDGPRGPQDGPGVPQGSPKTAQEPSKTAQEAPKTGDPNGLFGPSAPRGPQEAPRGPQEFPRLRPRGTRACGPACQRRSCRQDGKGLRDGLSFNPEKPPQTRKPVGRNLKITFNAKPEKGRAQTRNPGGRANSEKHGVRVECLRNPQAVFFSTPL